MTLPVSRDITNDIAGFNLHILLKSSGSGQFVASVAEWRDIQVTAATKEAAIEQLHKIVAEQIAEMEILTLPVTQPKLASERTNPWTEFIGMYKGDEDFAEIAAELRSERDCEAS